MIELLAIDIDGTLVTDGDRVTPLTRAALHSAQEHIALVLATGRRYRTTRQVLSTLGLELPVVCLGGALTKSPSGRSLHSTPFAPPAVVALTQLAHRHDLALIVQRDSHDLGGPDFVVDGTRSWNTATAHYVRVGGEAGHADPAFSRTPRHDALVVGCFGDHEPLAAFESDISTLPNWYETVLVPSKKTPGSYLEIIPAGVSKWAALKRYASGRGVAADAICAVGDALNDLPMIEGAGLGVAMGNADPAVKAAAAWTTGRNDEDGLVTLIERLLASRS